MLRSVSCLLSLNCLWKFLESRFKKKKYFKVFTNFDGKVDASSRESEQSASSVCPRSCYAGHSLPLQHITALAGANKVRRRHVCLKISVTRLSELKRHVLARSCKYECDKHQHPISSNGRPPARPRKCFVIGDCNSQAFDIVRGRASL